MNHSKNRTQIQNSSVILFSDLHNNEVVSITTETGIIQTIPGTTTTESIGRFVKEELSPDHLLRMIFCHADGDY